MNFGGKSTTLVQTTVKTVLEIFAQNINRVLGHPTTSLVRQLKEQHATAAAGVPSTAHDRQDGCLYLILDKDKFQLATVLTKETTNPLPKPLDVSPKLKALKDNASRYDVKLILAETWQELKVYKNT
jgi:hypothetical protein